MFRLKGASKLSISTYIRGASLKRVVIIYKTVSWMRILVAWGLLALAGLAMGYSSEEEVQALVQETSEEQTSVVESSEQNFRKCGTQWVQYKGVIPSGAVFAGRTPRN